MGLRFRKNYIFGKCFRVNISKSGVGYSFGFPGVRYTKLANGRNRVTCSVNGTGLSYVQESSNRKTNTTIKDSNECLTGTYNGLGTAENYDNLDEIKTDKNRKKFLWAIKLRILYRASLKYLFGILVFLSLANHSIMPMCFFVLLLLIYFGFGKVKVEYCADENSLKQYLERLEKIKGLVKSKKVFKINKSYNVTNGRYHSNVRQEVFQSNMITCKCKLRSQFPIKTNFPTISVVERNSKYFFLPDCLLIIRKLNVLTINYDELKIDNNINCGIAWGFKDIPKDVEILKYIPRYTNKNGTADRRFKIIMRFPLYAWDI